LRIYQSEIGRYRTRLAAADGDETLLRFFLNIKRTPEQADIDVDVLSALRNHLACVHVLLRACDFLMIYSDMETQFAALEQTLSTSAPELAQCMKAQADVLAELSATRKELEYYKRTFGNSSQMPPNVASLTSQLQYQQSEIERLRLFEQQASEVCWLVLLADCNNTFVRQRNLYLLSWRSFRQHGRNRIVNSRRRSST